MTRFRLVCRSKRFLLARRGRLMLPALITKLVTVNRGGGYTLLDSVLPSSVDRVVTQYISPDGCAGYRKFASGLMIQWASATFTLGETDTRSTGYVNFLRPFSSRPLAACTFSGDWSRARSGGGEAIETTGVQFVWVNNNTNAVGTIFYGCVIAIGR